MVVWTRVINACARCCIEMFQNVAGKKKPTLARREKPVWA